MAERTCNARDGPTRRQSFRRTRADAGLPDEYLEQLEQKRKQLDESIHKYIAAKERDFKTFEKELRLKYKQERQEQTQDGTRTARAPSDASVEATGSPRLQAQQQPPQQSVVDALLAAGLQRQHIGQPLSVALVDGDGSPKLEAKSAAGLFDRRASIDRNKEFVGVFTPAFLPALESNKAQPRTAHSPPPQRAESAPPESGQGRDTEQPTIIRAQSDHMVQGKAKRPVQLQLPQRTSSSGSSADGKLASALKSPTQGARPKRKRVSLAVGDSIVKPSDSVPTSLPNNNNTASHSRKRTSSSEREQSIDSTMANGTKEADMAPRTSSPVSPDMLVQPTVMPPPHTNGQRATADPLAPEVKPALPSSPLSRPPARMDADGDLFDLEEEEDMLLNPHVDSDRASESEDDVTGRVNRNVSSNETQDPDEGSSSAAEDDDQTAENIELKPGSVVATQQLSDPGFRRPSAQLDPIYTGSNYTRAEHNAAMNEVYGSSYIRPSSKGSFTPGSLGESFMARNAQLMRERSGSSSNREHMEVRS